MEQFTILQIHSSLLGLSKLNVHTRTDMSRQQKLVTHPAFVVKWIQPLSISGLKYPEEPSTLECLGYFFVFLY